MEKFIKINTIIFIAFTLIFSTSCSKYENMVVVKDCTGSYLRFNEKDYHICNIKLVDSYENGAEVKASFEKIDNCPEGDGVVCMMLHENEGWINITKIK